MTDTDLVLSAVGEPNRRQLLDLLHEQRESTVSELVDASGLRQPQVSKHLKVLAEADLVAVRTDGRYRHYRLDGRGLQAAHDWFASFDDVWHARFDALDELVSTPTREVGAQNVRTYLTRTGRSSNPDPNTTEEQLR